MKPVSTILFLIVALTVATVLITNIKKEKASSITYSQFKEAILSERPENMRGLHEFEFVCIQRKNKTMHEGRAGSLFVRADTFKVFLPVQLDSVLKDSFEVRYFNEWLEQNN